MKTTHTIDCLATRGQVALIAPILGEGDEATFKKMQFDERFDIKILTNNVEKFSVIAKILMRDTGDAS